MHRCIRLVTSCRQHILTGAILMVLEIVASFPRYSSTGRARSFLSRKRSQITSDPLYPCSGRSTAIPSRLSLFSGKNPDEIPHNQAQVYRIGAQTTLDNQQDSLLSQASNLTPVESQVVDEIWNWCANFVVPYNLCPWAFASVRNSRDAISMFLVEEPDSSSEQESHFERALYTASRMFQRLLMEEKKPVDPSHAIAFVVQVPSEVEWDFTSFYNWFLDAEEEMIENGIDDATDQSEVIWAPFHPEWSYDNEESEGNDDDPLQIEKQTPYPVVSIVDAHVIDKAGESTTAKIGLQNEEILSARSLTEWRELYSRAIKRSADDGKH